MDKIKIKNNSFEIPYLDEEGKNYHYEYSNEGALLNEITDLMTLCNCFITFDSYECIQFKNYKIKNYFDKKNFFRYIEVEKYERMMIKCLMLEQLLYILLQNTILGRNF